MSRSAENEPSSTPRRSSSSPAPRGTRGREQRGARNAIIVQADEFLGLSTVLVAPTSTHALPASFRPSIAIEGAETRVLL
jgi:mRNA interferase MazF